MDTVYAFWNEFWSFVIFSISLLIDNQIFMAMQASCFSLIQLSPTTPSFHSKFSSVEKFVRSNMLKKGIREMKISRDSNSIHKCKNEIQSPLVIVDSYVSSKLSTITRESTIKREIYAKTDIWFVQFIHYNNRIHY